MVVPWNLFHPDLAGALYLRTVDPLKGPQESAERDLEETFARLLRSGAEAQDQLTKLASSLASQRLRAIVIKGTSRLLRLSSSAIPRGVTDLDLVIPMEAAGEVDAALRSSGYTPEAWNSPEDAWLQLETGPGLRYLRDGCLPVDVQTWLPGVPRHRHILDEAWAGAQPSKLTTGGAEGSIRVLSPMHELLVECAHLCVHLEPPLTVSPKWITDMLLLVHANVRGGEAVLLPPVEGSTYAEKLDRLTLQDLIWPFEPVRVASEDGLLWSWASFWDTARRWGIERQAAVACATLNAHWNVGIPGVPSGVDPLPLERLLGEHAGHTIESAAARPVAYVERLRRARHLPTASARMRYLWHLAFPAPENLRARYGLDPKAFLLPWYARHVAARLWNVVRGLGAAGMLRVTNRR